MPSYSLGCSMGQEPCLISYQCIDTYLYCLYPQIPPPPFLECRGSSLVLTCEALARRAVLPPLIFLTFAPWELSESLIPLQGRVLFSQRSELKGKLTS